MKKLIPLFLLFLFGLAFGGDNENRIYGYVADVVDTADALANVKVTLELPITVNNSCDSTIAVRYAKTKLTNANGYFFFQAVYSSCLDSARYNITFEYNGDKITKSILIPDSDSTNTFTLF